MRVDTQSKAISNPNEKQLIVHLVDQIDNKEQDNGPSENEKGDLTGEFRHNIKVETLTL